MKRAKAPQIIADNKNKVQDFRIKDILGAIASIQAYTAGMDETAFGQDQKTIDAVTHNLAVIGNAATSVPKAIADAHPDINWKMTKELGNVVTGYFEVRMNSVWGTIQNDLPPLVPLLEKLLSDHP